MDKRLIACSWYGGKYSHLSWLLPLLDVPCNHYCEPFAGSGAVLLNRDPVHIETYNDIDGEVVNFFRVLREQTEELQRLLTYTPFSREEYEDACFTTPQDNITKLERARRFYIRARMTRMSLVQDAKPFRWAACVNTEGGTSVSKWVNSIPKLAEVAERLRLVQIECLPALEVIERYDSPDTLFYCDPPYLMSTRTGGKAYGNELTEQDHIQLATLLGHSKGKVALSGYESPLYNELYAGWHMTRVSVRASSTGTNEKNQREEILWTNYPPPSSVQLSLFQKEQSNEKA